MRRPVRRWARTLRYYLRIAEADDVARRYFVTNAFDGALTVLGVIVGAFVGGKAEPKVIVSAGIGVSLAMGLSGAIGAYEAERAERSRDLKDLEAHMFRSLRDTMIGKASKVVPLWVAFVDGVSPAVSALLPLFPLVLAWFALVPTDIAWMTSIILDLLTLFTLGLFLGRISKENIWIHGLVTTSAGALTALVLFFLLGV